MLNRKDLERVLDELSNVTLRLNQEVYGDGDSRYADDGNEYSGCHYDGMVLTIYPDGSGQVSRRLFGTSLNQDTRCFHGIEEAIDILVERGVQVSDNQTGTMPVYKTEEARKVIAEIGNRERSLAPRGLPKEIILSKCAAVMEDLLAENEYLNGVIGDLRQDTEAYKLGREDERNDWEAMVSQTVQIEPGNYVQHSEVDYAYTVALHVNSKPKRLRILVEDVGVPGGSGWKGFQPGMIQ